MNQLSFSPDESETPPPGSSLRPIFSLSERPRYEKQRAKTPSPGRDYTNLITDSSFKQTEEEARWKNPFEYDETSEKSDTEEWMHKYLPQLNQKEAKELELRNTLNSLEADMQMHTQEVHNLKRDKQILEAQIHIANNEKKLHIEEHALQRQKWEQEFKQLHARLNSERMQFKNEITLIVAQLNKLQQEVTRAKIQKQQKAEVYKQKLDMKDTEIYKKISEKEEIIKVECIQKLEKSLDEQSDIHNDLRTRLRNFQEDTKLIPKKPSKPVRRKSTRKVAKLESSKSSQVIVPRLHTSVMSQPLTERGQGDTLDELSYIIVSLEKEQAILESKLAALSQETTFDKERRKLQDMYEKNLDRLEAAKSMQQDLIKERVYNERVMY